MAGSSRYARPVNVLTRSSSVRMCALYRSRANVSLKKLSRQSNAPLHVPRPAAKLHALYWSTPP